jgi:hypothetical protein
MQKPGHLPMQMTYCIDTVHVDIAARMHSAYHYLDSPRVDGLNLGLWPPGPRDVPVCLLSFSPFDLDHLSSSLPYGIRPDQVLVLTRQVTIGPSPPNAWSYTFGKACRWLRAHQPASLMLLT